MEVEEKVDADSRGPGIFEAEILKAIHQLKDGKSEGLDGIPAEMWKVLGTEGTEAFVGLCCTMYNTRVWPEDWIRSVLIIIEKRPQTTKCNKHGTISLVVHASKVILRVLTNRIEPKAKAFISSD